MLRVAVAASGQGSVFEHVVLAARQRSLSYEVVLLVVSRPDAGAVARAAALGVPCEVLNPKDFDSARSWDEAFARTLGEYDVELLLLAGFLRKLGAATLKAFDRRIVNTHPSLLPKYGGQGMYGDAVYRAVLDDEATETGVTLHVVNDAYDEGRILTQSSLPVDGGDTVESLKSRVQALERQVLVDALEGIATGALSL